MKLRQRWRRLLFALVLSQIAVCVIFFPRWREWIFGMTNLLRLDNTYTPQPTAAPDLLEDISELDVPIVRFNASSLNPDQSELEEVKCVTDFMNAYEAYCENVTLARWSGESPSSPAEHCPCVPEKLLGRVNILVDGTALLSSEIENWNVSIGGRWLPDWCTARQKIAIIIPFFNRQSHLRQLMKVLHPTLQRQLVDYTIYVVEQAGPFEMFNKGILMNTGFVEARSRGPFDCYIFHDVDMLPEDDRNIYSCYKYPRHLGAYIRKHEYKRGFGETIGGVSAFTRKQFERVNGFTNECYGWGGEDNDMSNRLIARGMTYIRFPRCVSRYDMAAHEHGSDGKNPEGICRTQYYKRKKLAPVYNTVGLNSLSYKLVDFKHLELYTWLHVKVPPSPQQTASATSSITTTMKNSWFKWFNKRQ